MEALKANKRQFIRLCSPNCCGRNIPYRMFIISNTSLWHLYESMCQCTPLCDPTFAICISPLSISPPLRDNAENMHFFSSLALTLNESEEGVAPTDSRLRPDQRLMEAGLWDEANIQKQRLEDRQRLERKRREAQANQALEEGEHKDLSEMVIRF